MVRYQTSHQSSIRHAKPGAGEESDYGEERDEHPYRIPGPDRADERDRGGSSIAEAPQPNHSGNEALQVRWTPWFRPPSHHLSSIGRSRYPLDDSDRLLVGALFVDVNGDTVP